MNLYRIYPSVDSEEFVCTTMAEDPLKALELTLQTCVGQKLTETAYAEKVDESEI